jgi:N6-L-threonylcarbamoyladenine synthase
VSGPVVLAIETSCDETAIAVVEGGRRVLANVVASQVALHAPTGGIVPEVAARAHLRWIVPVLDAALADAGVRVADVDAVAVTNGPGLVGSLLVGVSLAKGLAWAHDRPLVAVNHLEGHVRAAWLLEGDADEPPPDLPAVVLVVSGGHTFLVEMRDELEYRRLGTTQDDAAGEAFDKIGRLLGLPYPGGPAIQVAALRAIRRKTRLPRAWLGGSFDFSFSGLKTAARRTVAAALEERGLDPTDPAVRLPDEEVAELAWAAQDAIVDVLATKTLRAAAATGARSIVLGGGVAANAALRDRIVEGAPSGVRVVIPRPALCTDNGAMIGAAGTVRFLAGARAGLDLSARATMPLAS